MEETAEEWVTLQTKTFTRWCNSHLRTRNLEIADLFTDVSDGTILLNLLEIIGKDTILATCGRKFTPPAKCKMEIHKLENCNLIFEYLKARELKIVNIGSSDIKDGSPRKYLYLLLYSSFSSTNPAPGLVLGLLWTIILRFAIDEDGKEGLLLWCRKNTKEKNPEVEINNFSRSWQDGLGFAALLNKFRPDLINYNDMLARKDDPMFVMNAAFDAAEQVSPLFTRCVWSHGVCGVCARLCSHSVCGLCGTYVWLTHVYSLIGRHPQAARRGGHCELCQTGR